MKRMAILVLVLLVGCGKKIIEESSLPDNQASPIESAELDVALMKIQADFDQYKINVNIRTIPYHVNRIDPAMGVCYKSGGRPKGIALDHSLFNETSVRTTELGLLYKVLLHEIGHCFFNRDHDDSRFELEQGKMLITLYPERGPEVHDSIPNTLMGELGWFIIPKSIWPYYVQELAGMKRFESVEHVREFVDVTVVPR